MLFKKKDSLQSTEEIILGTMSYKNVNDDRQRALFVEKTRIAAVAIG